MAISFTGASAQETPLFQKKLRVGTEEAPPFAMKDQHGVWTGISIELWRQIAAELNVAYELCELHHHDLLEGIANGSLDVAAATEFMGFPIMLVYVASGIISTYLYYRRPAPAVEKTEEEAHAPKHSNP